METNGMIPIGTRVAFVSGGYINVGYISRVTLTMTFSRASSSREVFYEIDSLPSADGLMAVYTDVPEWSIFRSLEEAEKAFESVLRKMKGQ